MQRSQRWSGAVGTATRDSRRLRFRLRTAFLRTSGSANLASLSWARSAQFVAQISRDESAFKYTLSGEQLNAETFSKRGTCQSVTRAKCCRLGLKTKSGVTKPGTIMRGTSSTVLGGHNFSVCCTISFIVFSVERTDTCCSFVRSCSWSCPLSFVSRDMVPIFYPS